MTSSSKPTESPSTTLVEVHARKGPDTMSACEYVDRLNHLNLVPERRTAAVAVRTASAWLATMFAICNRAAGSNLGEQVGGY